MKFKFMSAIVVAALVLSLVSMAIVSPTVSAQGPVTRQVNNWVKNSTAVVTEGSTGTFDAGGAGAPSVIKDSTTYKMWYTGRSGGTGQQLGTLSIGYATSTSLPTFSKVSAVTLSGTAGTWEARGQGFASVMKDGTTYKMWYTGYSGAGASTASAIGYATSTDGITWTRSGTSAVVPPVAGTWEAMGVGVPSVIKDGSTYKMWYTGVKSDLVPNIGYATSTDGITWTKYSSNPVLTRDAGGPSVILDSGVYRMWYTTRDATGVLQIGYASSNNGTEWAKASSAELTASLTFEGPGAGGVGSPSVLKDGTLYRLWYTGLSASLMPNIGYAAPTVGGTNYNTIQAAINAAASGDTILVHAGTYPEQLSVASGLSGLTIKSLDIVTMPVINATGFNPAVTIAAPGATFKGFIVSGATDRGIILSSTAIGSTVAYNSITGTTSNPSGLGVFNGLVDQTTTGTTTAGPNWWGNASGPAGVSSGSGSSIVSTSANTGFAPWFTQTPLTWLQDRTGYFGNYRMVGAGWNVLSTPYALDAVGDTWGEIVALGRGLNIHPTSPAYYYNAATQSWAQATSTYVLNPVDAVYVRMAGPDNVLLLASASVSAPAKSLSAGWNLFSLSDFSSPYRRKADSALLSLVSASATLYSQVVSPALNQQGWVFTLGDTIAAWDTTPGAANPGWLRVEEGYWVNMTSATTLAGFTFTPFGANVPSTW